MKKRFEREFSRSQKEGSLLKPASLSLAFHILLFLVIAFNLKTVFIKGQPGLYRVSITPISSLGRGMEGSRGSGPPIGQSVSTAPENRSEIQGGEKTAEVLKKEEKAGKRREKNSIEGLKPSRKEQKKSEESVKALEQAMEEIRKQAALDHIRNRVASRRKEDLESVGSSSKGGPGVGGSGIGSSVEGTYGTGRSGLPFGSPSLLDIRLSEYYDSIWAKIKKEWAFPESLSGKKSVWEAVIVLTIDKEGRVQKLWFEKKSGNNLYDQMAARAIKKAEPFPPLPKEWSENTLEIGIRFHPE
jgi:colicin import membrane protein/protein TonB